MITVTSAAPRKTIAKYVVGRGIKKVKLYDVMSHMLRRRAYKYRAAR